MQNQLIEYTTVYDNGINQTEVVIHMNAVNQFNEEITGIPSEMLLKHSLLLDFIKGEVLLDATTVPLDQREATWSYSRGDNGYNVEAPTPPEFHSVTPSLPLNIDAAVATFFVMCGPDTPARTLQIAVQVSLTHPKAPRKVYQTSITGTPGFEKYMLGFSVQLTPYQVNYWYLNPPPFEIANDYLGQERSSFNPVETMVTARLRTNEVEVFNDPGALVCYKFTIPANHQIPFGWSSAERYGMSLKLTDR